MCDKAIVSVPLGVLQSRDIEFEPELPKDIVRAIDAMGSGILEKLVLKFDEVFWNPNLNWLNYIAEVPYDWT